jgi:FkbM family methyltransferase
MLRSAIANFCSVWRRMRDRSAQNEASAVQEIRFPSFSLSVRSDDHGGQMYNDRPAFEETQSLLYPLVQKEITPALVIDVGANYGLTALIYAEAFPSAHIVAVEPSPELLPLLKRNLGQLPAKRVTVLSAACGAKSGSSLVFGINPNSSQDNRVIPQAGWPTVEVQQTTIDDIAKLINASSSLFIKVDTQGYELNVFKGAEATLSRCSRWLVKTEFAPHWLLSQGTQPCQMLEYLVERYLVFESPVRIPFGSSALSHLLGKPLERHQVEAFVDHVTNLNRNSTGWVDLLIRPRN